MSIKVMQHVWEHSQSRGVARLVLLAIADRCNDEGAEAWPSMSTICAKANCSERQGQRALKELEDAGELVVERGKGRHGTHRFAIPMQQTPVRMSPRQDVTPSGCRPDTMTGGPRQDVTPPPSGCHPTPVMVSPNTSCTSLTSSTSEEELRLSARRPRAEDVQALWNELTQPPIPRCKDMLPARRRHVEARLREFGLDGLREVFMAINALPFCRGENDRGWRANFDWALKPSSIAKVREGNYIDCRPESPARGRRDATAAAGPAVQGAAATRRMLAELEA